MLTARSGSAVARLGAALALSFSLAAATAEAATFTVAPRTVEDQKAVFATVESLNVVPARARIGGTVADLSMVDGDKVAAGQTLAVVTDEKLALQIKSLNAEIAGLQAEVDQAKTNLTRAQDLFAKGTVPRSRLDDAQTALDVATKTLEAKIAARSVVEQQVTEGAVLAPASGRVLKVGVTVGTVVAAGESLANIAEENYVLRLKVPERHARSMKSGDPVRLDGAAIGSDARAGKITLVYPQIEDGHVVADASVAGLGDYFVGERLRVWVSAGTRQAIVVPAGYVTTRYGIDYVRVSATGGGTEEVPVQRGEPLPLPDLPDGLEILSGVHAGDVLVQP